MRVSIRLRWFQAIVPVGEGGRGGGGGASDTCRSWIKVYGLETISCLANAIAWIGSGVEKRGWPYGQTPKAIPFSRRPDLSKL